VTNEDACRPFSQDEPFSPTVNWMGSRQLDWRKQTLQGPDGAILMALSTRMCRSSPRAQSPYTVLVDTRRYAATSLTVN